MPEITESHAEPAAAADDSAAPDPLVGRVINERFRITAPIARGGMGKVYQAEQLPLGRVCALKILDPHYTGQSNPEFHKRFFLEASIAAKLKHPNAVTIYDYGQTADDVYFIAMEYLEGRTLHQVVREQAPLPAARALGIARQVCRALREAHRLGVIHRDLKPANIFLVDQDEEADFVKVLDFGLVKQVAEAAEDKITQTGLFMGSPKYMAPEQIRGEPIAPATDVYALGVVMFVMLTGHAPFERHTSLDVLAAHLTEPVPAMRDVVPAGVEVPAAVEAVVRRCLEKKREDRFASMDELLAALKRAGGSGDAPGDRMSLPAGTSVSGEYSFSSAALRSAVASAAAVNAANAADVPVEVASGDVTVSAGRAAKAVAVPSMTPPPAARRGRAPWVAAIAAVALLGAVGVGVMATRPPRAPGGSAPGGATATPAPRVVHVELDSDPPGAEVFEAGALVGRTPLRLAWQGPAQGDPSRPHTFVFRMPGHREVSATLSGERLVYSAQLAREEPAVAATGTSDAGATGEGANARPGARGPNGTNTRPGVQGTQRPGRPGTRHNAPPGYRWVDDW